MSHIFLPEDACEPERARCAHAMRLARIAFALGSVSIIAAAYSFVQWVIR